jgi:hypothetical protein
MKLRFSPQFFAAALVAATTLLSFQARAQSSDELWILAHAAYTKKDYVDSLKYFFAYKIVVGSQIDSDPTAKKQMTDAIVFSERMLRANVAIGTYSALSDKKIQIEGGLKTANPWARFDAATIIDVTKANATHLEK